ncbi:unnamed protein product [Ilex paraguariensis]|uniref:NB-ARC domain-containing protein n=1 Tax=Ilex paraguariensis TaxID=185542 RepID=A0ABC8U135_9AQUA
MVGFKSGQRLARLVGILSLVLTILERREEIGVVETFAVEALGITQNVVDLWDRLCLKWGQNCISPSAVLNFFTTFEPIGNQIKDLIQREIGMDQHVVGLEEDVQRLTSHLIVDNATNRVVWIVGRQGIGKKLLPRRFVPVSAPVLIATPGQDKAKPMEEFLHKILINSRCLIVFDDVWTPEDWVALQKLLPAQYNGNKIMITTHSRNTIPEVSIECFVHEKQALSDEEVGNYSMLGLVLIPLWS